MRAADEGPGDGDALGLAAAEACAAFADEGVVAVREGGDEVFDSGGCGRGRDGGGRGERGGFGEGVGDVFGYGCGEESRGLGYDGDEGAESGEVKLGYGDGGEG